MNDFTKGDWYTALDDGVWCGDKIICKVDFKNIVGDQPEEEANAQLIATAGTTATKLAEQGYDAVRVLEVLPELVDLVSHMDSSLGAVELLEQCTTGQTTKHKAP